MPQTTAESTVDFREVGARIRRRWRVVTLVGLLVLDASILGAIIVPPQYTSTASLAVSPIQLTATSSSSDINIDTEREVIGSNQVAQIAAKALGHGVTADTLVNSSSIAAPTGSNVLDVSVTSASPADSAEWANAIADAYLTFRAQTADQSAKASIAALDERIKAVPLSNKSTLANLQAQRLALAQIGESVGRIIGTAEASDPSSSLGAPVYAVGGLLGGLLLGMIAALVWDASDRRVRFAARLAELSGRTAIAVRGEDDEEGLRWLYRAARRAPESRRTGPLVVSVLDVRDHPTGDLVAGLADLIAGRSQEVDLLDSMSLPARHLDGNWRYATVDDRQVAVVLVDARHVTSGARRAALADASDVVIVLANGRSRVRTVIDLLDELHESGAQLVPVYMSAPVRKSATARDAEARQEGPTRKGDAVLFDPTTPDDARDLTAAETW